MFQEKLNQVVEGYEPTTNDFFLLGQMHTFMETIIHMRTKLDLARDEKKMRFIDELIMGEITMRILG